MPLPQKVITVPQPLDPTDIEKFTVTITKAGEDNEPFPILDLGESIASYTLALTAEAIAVGLRIKEGPPYYTTLSGRFLNFTLEVDEAMRGLAAFYKGGVMLGIELTVTTDAPAPRRKQRTLAVKVVQQ